MVIYQISNRLICQINSHMLLKPDCMFHYSFVFKLPISMSYSGFGRKEMISFFFEPLNDISKNNNFEVISLIKLVIMKNTINVQGLFLLCSGSEFSYEFYKVFWKHTINTENLDLFPTSCLSTAETLSWFSKIPVKIPFLQRGWACLDHEIDTLLRSLQISLKK